MAIILAIDTKQNINIRARRRPSFGCFTPMKQPLRSIVFLKKFAMVIWEVAR